MVRDIARQLAQIGDRMECSIRPGLVAGLAAQFRNRSLSEEVSEKTHGACPLPSGRQTSVQGGGSARDCWRESAWRTVSRKKVTENLNLKSDSRVWGQSPPKINKMDVTLPETTCSTLTAEAAGPPRPRNALGLGPAGRASRLREGPSVREPPSELRWLAWIRHRLLVPFLLPRVGAWKVLFRSGGPRGLSRQEVSIPLPAPMYRGRTPGQ